MRRILLAVLILILPSTTAIVVYLVVTKTTPTNRAAIGRVTTLAGSGIDTLHAWAYPVGGGAPIFVGVDNVGGPNFTIRGTLAPGTYDLVVYAHSAASNTFAGAQVVRVVVR